MQPQRRTSIGIILTVLGALSGCQRDAGDKAPLPEGEQAVRLLVLEGPGGTALALVPVYINEQGPFTFALDTGASHSLIDADIARTLDLPVAGPKVLTTGVATTTEAVPLRVERWRVGDVHLPPRSVVTIDMPEGNRQFKLQGLLGSDVLSLFGSIVVDYEGQVLTLNPDGRREPKTEIKIGH